jgi:hypothetical protein
VSREQINELAEATLEFAAKIGASWVTPDWVRVVLGGEPDAAAPGAVEDEKRRILVFIRDALSEMGLEDEDAKEAAEAPAEAPADPRSDIELAISNIAEVLGGEPDGVVLFAYKVKDGRALARMVFSVPPDLRPFHKAAMLDHQVELVLGRFDS